MDDKTDFLNALAQYLTEKYANVQIHKNRIIVLEQGDPYIIKFRGNRLIVRRWWDNAFLIAIVALIIYGLISLVLWIGGWHLQQQTIIAIWVIFSSISVVGIAHNNRLQKEIIRCLEKDIKTFKAG